MKRREFIVKSTGLIGSVLVFTRCSGSGSDTPNTQAQNNNNQQGNPSCANGGGITYTNPGHSHTVSNLTVNEITQALAGDYALLGGGHSHTFTLTAADFQNLKSAQTISKTDNEGHGHIINILCV
ncbi:MAG: hypothetical protein AABY64_00365 [Bdellovibrionota bacterium]